MLKVGAVLFVICFSIASFASVRGAFYVLDTEVVVKAPCAEVSQKITSTIEDELGSYKGLTYMAANRCTLLEDGQALFWINTPLAALDDDGVTALKDFLSKYQDQVLYNKKMHFALVTGFAIPFEVEVGTLTGTGESGSPLKLAVVHKAINWHTYQFEDEFASTLDDIDHTIDKGDAASFLAFVEKEYGTDERAQFQTALENSDGISGHFMPTYLLDDGRGVEAYGGWGGLRDCRPDKCSTMVPKP